MPCQWQAKLKCILWITVTKQGLYILYNIALRSTEHHILGHSRNSINLYVFPVRSKILVSGSRISSCTTVHSNAQSNDCMLCQSDSTANGTD